MDNNIDKKGKQLVSLLVQLDKELKGGSDG